MPATLPVSRLFSAKMFNPNIDRTYPHASMECSGLDHRARNERNKIDSGASATRGQGARSTSSDAIGHRSVRGLCTSTIKYCIILTSHHQRQPVGSPGRHYY